MAQDLGTDLAQLEVEAVIKAYELAEREMPKLIEQVKKMTNENSLLNKKTNLQRLSESKKPLKQIQVAEADVAKIMKEAEKSKVLMATMKMGDGDYKLIFKGEDTEKVQGILEKSVQAKLQGVQKTSIKEKLALAKKQQAAAKPKDKSINKKISKGDMGR